MAVAPVQHVADRPALGDDAAIDEPPRRRPSNWLVAGLALLLVLPLLVGVIGFREPTWTPVLDLAQTELRVRDVGTSHTPLIGLPGRINYDGNQGSHPGPLSFYALAPTYRLLGASAWSLQAATVVVQAAAVVVALLLARRRRGLPLLLGVAALLAVLINGFGAATLTEPWNPYLPLLWWVVVLLAVWSVVCGDIAMLPVAVAAASFCGQTHVPYLVLSVGLGVLAAAAIVVQYRKADKPARAHITRWVGASAALGFVLWLPPIIDQVRHSPGNLAILFNYFTNSPSNAEPAAGLSDAATVVLRHLDVFHLSADQLAHPGLLVANDAARHASGLRGALLLVAWAVAALVAWRVRSHHRGLVRLHLVTATALGLSFIATSRIYGEVWYYLVLSMWAITGMMVVASIWTAVVVVKPRVHDPSRLARIGLALLVAITVVFSVRSAVDATVAEHSDATVVRELHAVVPGTVTALDHDQRYLLGTDDAAFILSPLYGMLNELDRRGFDVGVTRSLGPIATTHRVTSEDDADARIQIATGKWIDAWRQIPDAREVASYDPRSPEQKARFDQLHAEVTDLLTAQGHADIVPLVDDNLFAASITPGVGRDIRSRLEEMLSLGVPIAVFIAPTQAHITP